jgi:hypothetical protein
VRVTKVLWISACVLASAGVGLGLGRRSGPIWSDARVLLIPAGVLFTLLGVLVVVGVAELYVRMRRPWVFGLALVAFGAGVTFWGVTVS